MAATSHFPNYLQKYIKMKIIMLFVFSDIAGEAGSFPSMGIR
jgi:hypothetical protein